MTKLFSLLIHTKYSSKESHGFTLIELLVSIAIVGVIFGIILSSAAAIQRNARDTQRKNDLKNIQSGLQRYYADQGFYPTSIGFILSSLANASFTNKQGNPNNPSVTKTYINKIPFDPTGIKPYCYIALSNKSGTDSSECSNNDESQGYKRCYYYKLYADLENGSTSSLTCDGRLYNFEVTPDKY